MQKMILKNIFSSWWTMQFSEKKNGKWNKNRDIKHVTTESRRSYLASEPNYCTTKKFSENFLAIAMRREITYIHE